MLALKTLGCPDIRVIGPKTLLPIGLEQYGVSVYHDMNEGLRDVDVVIMLRLQRERMQGGLLPSEGEFYRLYGLTTAAHGLAKPDAIVMHPGPINRGVEIESAVADGAQSVILNQVTYGIAIRMAVLSMAMSGQTAQRQLEQEYAGRGAELMPTQHPRCSPDRPGQWPRRSHRYLLPGRQDIAFGQAPAGFKPAQTIDAQGLVAAPGLVDLSVALREPGYSRKGNIASETLAATAGGITSLCCPPQTKPVLDTAAVSRTDPRPRPRVRPCQGFPVGALTRNLAGEQLSELVALRDAGCVAFGNGLANFTSNRNLGRALEYAATFRPHGRHPFPGPRSGRRWPGP
jgi:hypothetical protein